MIKYHRNRNNFYENNNIHIICQAFTLTYWAVMEGLRQGLKMADRPHVWAFGLPCEDFRWLEVCTSTSMAAELATVAVLLVPIFSSFNSIERIGSFQIRPEEPCRRNETEDLCNFDIFE
ncbi:hypothetical protein KFK09_015824 [Dendrobium nobile]|uniref:Uncharacterized protein n=1 Tax=Dendrobium nobile TaxID=94219 RepID=A0A8T3B5V5_DENNO|nr:hypothetical protein KFK09_015824 [Dendrobium nobile]